MKDLNKTPSCCKQINTNKEKGFLTGLISGLIPHTFCILFIVFSTLGVTLATFLFKDLLLNRNFFYYLIALSFIFSTLTAVIYLRRNQILSFKGVIRSWRYLTVLYGITIGINLLLFFIVFPATANYSSKQLSNRAIEQSSLTLKVNIPCSGHASLITSELSKLPGIQEVKFRLPNIFDVYYDVNRITKQEILSLEVFKTYKATVL